MMYELANIIGRSIDNIVTFFINLTLGYFLLLSVLFIGAFIALYYTHVARVIRQL